LNDKGISFAAIEQNNCRKTNTNQEISSRLRKQHVYLTSPKNPLVSTLGLFLPESGLDDHWLDSGELRRLNEVEIGRLHRRTSCPMPDKQKAAAPKERRL